MTKGGGITTVSSVILQLKYNIESFKRVQKVLFGSGSDGDIAFIRKSEKASIDMHK